MGIPEPPKDKLIDLTLSFCTNRTSEVSGQEKLTVMDTGEGCGCIFGILLVAAWTFDIHPIFGCIATTACICFAIWAMNNTAPPKPPTIIKSEQTSVDLPIKEIQTNSIQLSSIAKDFSQEEEAAIFFVAGGMMQIDGQRDPRELILMVRVNMKLSIDDKIIQLSSELPKEEMLLIIRNMSYEKREFVAQYLSALMGIDGDMDVKEMKLLAYITEECALPADCVSEDSLKYFFDMVYKS